MRRMTSLRNMLRDRSLLVLLTLAVVLRSMIAPGFMLDTSADSPLGISLTFCEGFAGINSVKPASTDEHSGHHAHAMHMDHAMPADDSTHADHNQDHSMPSASCAALSISSTFIDIPHDLTAPLAPQTAAVIRSEESSPLYQNSHTKPQQPRAPPVSLTI